MHTVVETPAYLSAADLAGISEAEREGIVVTLARDPMLGVEIKGTGGCRKFRFAGRGKGKSGGYRIITFFTGKDLPVYLITAFGKNMKDNLSDAEANELKKLTKQIVLAYRVKVRRK